MSPVPSTPAMPLDLLPRYALLAGYVADLHVLDMGGLCLPGLGLWLTAGASQVDVVTDDLSATQSALAAQGLTPVNVLGPDAFNLAPEGSYDLILCHDLSPRLAADPALLLRLRRLLSPAGVLLTAVAGTDGEQLEQLLGRRWPSDLPLATLQAQLAPLFGAISLLGQSPVLGSLFYDLNDDDDPEPSLDRAYMPEAEIPGWTLLWCGPDPMALDCLNLVQLPLGLATAQPAAMAQRLASLQAAQDALLQQLAQQATSLTEMHAELAQAQLQASAPAMAEHALTEKPSVAHDTRLRTDGTATAKPTQHDSASSASPSPMTGEHARPLHASVDELEDLLRDVGAEPTSSR